LTSHFPSRLLEVCPSTYRCAGGGGGVLQEKKRKRRSTIQPSTIGLSCASTFNSGVFQKRHHQGKTNREGKRKKKKKKKKKTRQKKEKKGRKSPIVGRTRRSCRPLHSVYIRNPALRSHVGTLLGEILSVEKRKREKGVNVSI